MKSNLLKLAAGLLALTLLAACATDSAEPWPDHQQDSPAVQLVVHSHGGEVIPLGVTPAPVTVSAFPTLGVRVRDFTEVRSVDYRVDLGPWQSLGLNHVGRTTFIPDLPLGEQTSRVTVRAVNAEGGQTQISNNFRIDATPPVLTRVQLNSHNLLGNIGGGAVQLVEPPGTPSAHLSVRATDGPYPGGELRVVLLQSGAVLAEGEGGVLDYSFDLSDPAGEGGLSVYAVDGVGNRTALVSFSVRAEPEPEPDPGLPDDDDGSDGGDDDSGDDGGDDD